MAVTDPVIIAGRQLWERGSVTMGAGATDALPATFMAVIEPGCDLGEMLDALTPEQSAQIRYFIQGAAMARSGWLGELQIKFEPIPAPPKAPTDRVRRIWGALLTYLAAATLVSLGLFLANLLWLLIRSGACR